MKKYLSMLMALIIVSGTSVRAAEIYLQAKPPSAILSALPGLVAGMVQSEKPPEPGEAGPIEETGEAKTPEENAFSPQLSAVWIGINDSLSEIIDRRARHGSYPDEAWFAEDKRSNERKIAELVASLRGMLLSSPVLEAIADRHFLPGEITRLQGDIDANTAEMLEAPAETNLPFTKTKAEYQKIVEDLEASAVAARERLARSRVTMLAEAARWAGAVGPDRETLVFSSCIGEDMLLDAAALENVRTIVGRMADVGARNGSDIVVRFYEAYTELVDALLAKSAETREKIQSAWLPRVSAIHAEAERTVRSAYGTLAGGTLNMEQEDLLLANVEKNRPTIRICVKYKAFLEEQIRFHTARIEELDKCRIALENALDTARNSVASAGNSLVGPRMLDAPALIRLPQEPFFDNPEQNRMFVELTQRIVSAESGERGGVEFPYPFMKSLVNVATVDADE